MKILIVGANGQIGRHLIEKLAETEHKSVAMVRKEEQESELRELGADEVVIGDLEKDFSHAFEGVDSIIFTAGSGGHTGADKTILIDLWGAIKTIDQAKEHNISRFLLVSSMNADTPDTGIESMKHYFVAKKLADDHLRSSGLDYTIVRPGGLLNEPATGKILLEEKIKEFSSREITREDVAAVLAEAVDLENTYKKTFEILNGETPIKEALKQV
ncbi:MULTISPECIES: SDR family oxidoreductase [Bacillaceae]|uniref:SDR family oxidoreductase n=1 Tax=Bacillaceae TaxID=186817 RepID=UPI0029643B44|nr:SDR family oxidoreductase [Bacillus infantis]MDW2878863.1 SDR family oxidoreductase [Bacillus infantis]